ncbi:MAG: hypothetical protein PWP08_1118 [Methanofollis sp.]|nr:hypothetical protein [Methanofollis sp.]
MEIMEIINEVLGQSHYLGSYPYYTMVRQAKSEASAIAVFVDRDRNAAILYSRGEPTGAIYRDTLGALFGDSAVLKISDQDDYDLYAVDLRAVELVVAHCRVFNRGHFPHRLSADIPEIGTKRRIPGVLSLLIVRNGAEQSGVRVSIKKGRQVLASDVTTGDGKASFRLMNGSYDVVISSRTGEAYSFLVNFNGKRSELIIELDGITDE